MDTKSMHLEVKALLDFKPKDDEEKYIYNRALEEFFNTHAKYILGISVAMLSGIVVPLYHNTLGGYIDGE